MCPASYSGRLQFAKPGESTEGRGVYPAVQKRVYQYWWPRFIRLGLEWLMYKKCVRSPIVCIRYCTCRGVLLDSAKKKVFFAGKTLESLFLRRPLLGRDRQDTVDMYKYCSKNTCWNTKWRPLTFWKPYDHLWSRLGVVLGCQVSQFW